MIEPRRTTELTLLELKIIQAILNVAETSEAVDIILWKLGHQITFMTPESEPEYDKRHGGPWDRGSADAYYGRPNVPHYYVRGSITSPRIGIEHMTAPCIAAYNVGYAETIASGDRKDWGGPDVVLDDDMEGDDNE